MLRHSIRLRRLVARTVAGTALAVAASAATAATFVDEFTAEQLVTVGADLGVPTNPKSASSTVAEPTAVGGFRDIQVTRTSGNAGDSAQVTSFSQLLETNVGANDLARYRVVWDGDNISNNLNTTNSFDLAAGGNTGIFMAVRSDGVAPGTVTVYNGNTAFSSGFNLPGLGFLAPFTIISLPFASFGGANFSQVSAVVLEIRTDLTAPGIDSTIDFIVASVPEPGSLALLLGGLAMAGLMFVRRTRSL